MTKTVAETDPFEGTDSVPASAAWDPRTYGYGNPYPPDPNFENKMTK